VEIDTEVIELLANTAKENNNAIADWSKTLPVGVSKRD